MLHKVVVCRESKNSLGSKRNGEGGQARPHFNKARDLWSALTPFKLPVMKGPSVGLNKS